MIKVLSIVGSTASGKSKLAIELAQKFDGEIISCDSVQIYKYFNIGSAKPSLDELNLVPHHLIDILEPTTICNAGFWKDHAIQIVNKIVQCKKLPIIVGGTGLYLKSLYQGMFEENSRNQTYRDLLYNESKETGIAPLFHKLQQKDPEYAQKIAPTDTLRIIRALEAIYVTNIKFSELHKQNVKPSWKWIFTQPLCSKEEINLNIERRVHTMFQMGLIEETKILLNKFGKDVTPMKTIGYRHIIELLENQIEFIEMKEKLIQDTKRYAKRQRTLFRSLLSNTQIIDPYLLLQGKFL